MWSIAVLLLACQQPVETDQIGPITEAAAREIAVGWTHRVVEGVLVMNGPEGPRQLLEGVVAEPVQQGTNLAVLTRTGDSPFTAIVWVEREARSWSHRTLYAPQGAPDRLAVSPDGRFVAFVSGHTGVSSVYVVPTAGGEPTQLTNVGLEQIKHAPGLPPTGFVASPVDQPPRFTADGARLEWTGPDGVALSVEVPK